MIRAICCPEIGGVKLQYKQCPGDNQLVPNSSDRQAVPASSNPFQAGAMVVVTLGNPRDKCWGEILALTVEGLSLCGIELASFDDTIAVVKEGGPFSPGVVFLPMHRIERIEMDLPDWDVPSLSQRFAERTGLNAAEVLGQFYASHLAAGGDGK